jgi:hypothetical protein
MVEDGRKQSFGKPGIIDAVVFEEATILDGSQLRPEPAGQRQFSPIQTGRLPDHEFYDLDVLIDLTDQKVHLACVKRRC